MYGVARDITARRRAEAEQERLVAEQAALRRVATVVARGGSQTDVFNAIAEELRQLIDADSIVMFHFQDGSTAVSVAAGGTVHEAFAVGSRHKLGGDNPTSLIRRTGETVRIDTYDRTATGPIADKARPTGIRSAVGMPLIVDGRLWGAVTIGTTDEEPLPADTEARLEQFIGLMATAIANTESRESLRRLADEQAALRRVATLVAEGASPGAMLDAVAGEMEALLDADQVALNRFEPGEEILALAHRGADVPRVPVGSRVSTKGESATARVRRTGRPARLEDYEGAGGPIAEGARATGLRSSVAVPIAAEGSDVWGVITASWKRTQPPPANT
jgi:GAF domain-containing protein